jgi:ParB family chromosome partitioning protein
MQALLRAGEIPIREARNLATLPPHEQLSAWRARQAASELTAVNPDTESEAPAPRPRTTNRVSPAASAIRRLGGTPPKIAASLRSELDANDLKELINLLMQEL